MKVRTCTMQPVLLPLLVGCGSTVLENVRNVTYPPDTNDLSAQKYAEPPSNLPEASNATKLLTT